MDTRRGGWWLGGLCTAVLVGSLCFSPPSEANVYKWKDPQGRIHYTDRPPPPDGVLIAIEQNYYVKRSGEPSAAQNAAPRTPVVDPTSTTPGEEARLKRQVADDVSSAQSENCKNAKERYQKYIQSQKLFKEGPNKERVYLSDEELTQARVEAKRDMDEACAAVR